MTTLYQKYKRKIKENYFLYAILINVKAYASSFLNNIFGHHYLKIRFFKRMGYPLDLKNPQSIDEKVNWKKIYDRNPLLPLTADKYQVRSYIQEILGEDKAKEHLIPLLYVTDKPETIPFERLPSSFIVKPNHASGRYIIVEDGKFNKEEIIHTCKKWLVTPYGLDKLEWAYKPIKRVIVVERLLREEKINILKEFKLHMFRGRCKLIAFVYDRINNFSMSFFDEKWNKLSVRIQSHPYAPKIEKPKNFELMIELAEKLSRPFDYIRVDLYNLKGKIFIGELTHYPASGMDKFEPVSFSYELGNHWKLEPEYWKNEYKIKI